MNKNYSFHISFSRTWILSRRNDPVLPVETIAKEVSNKYRVTKIKTKVSECEGIIEAGNNESEMEYLDGIKKLVLAKYDIDPDDFSVELDECEDVPEEETEKQESSDDRKKNEKKQEEDTEESTENAPADKNNSLSADDLIGADEFKELLSECSAVAQALRENDTVDSFTTRSYVISINDGYGLTTYLDIFASHMEKTGLFKFASKTRVVEVKLAPPDTKHGNDGTFAPVLQYFQGRSSCKLISVDISEWMNKLTSRDFRDFLKKIDEHVGENILFFRVPFVEKSVIMQIKNDLNDMLFVKEISIPPFTNDELIKCADSIIRKKQFTMQDDAWEVFSSRIAAEKSDGRFYGINTVNKIIREMLYIKQLHNVRCNVCDKIIKAGEITELADQEFISGKSGYDKLSEMIGMDGIAEKVREIVAQIETSVGNESLGSPCIHMRFVGNPGTGKTTVARILGSILKERGILRNGSFFEYSGRDLCGRFVGETAPKTSAICRDAYGSVLFIDEAYSLYRDEGYSNADYGREAIDTLVAEMENHRDDLVVIMAGYPDEMDKLLNGNIGLKSRMPYMIEFPNYTREQLAKIFFNMADKVFTYDDAFSEAVNSYFENLSDSVLGAKDFSNARYVRNLFERTWGKAALRCQMSRIPCDTLIVEDFALAASDKEFNNILEQKKRSIGF